MLARLPVWFVGACCAQVPIHSSGALLLPVLIIGTAESSCRTFVTSWARHTVNHVMKARHNWPSVRLASIANRDCSDCCGGWDLRALSSASVSNNSNASICAALLVDLVHQGVNRRPGRVCPSASCSGERLSRSSRAPRDTALLSRRTASSRRHISSSADKLRYEKCLLDLGVKASHQDVVAFPAHRNGAKAFARKIAETLFRFSQRDRTGCVELVPGITAAVHNDVGFHGTLQRELAGKLLDRPLRSLDYRQAGRHQAPRDGKPSRVRLRSLPRSTFRRPILRPQPLRALDFFVGRGVGANVPLR